MTGHDSHHPRVESTTETDSPPRTTLPFDYEDRTDGVHERLMAEVAAAFAWTRRQRAMGLRPN